jgi:hypothetical protein
MDESALKASISSLEASRGSLDFWLNASSLVVVIGVVLEIVFVIREYKEDSQDWRRGFVHPPERPSRRWLVMELIGVALVSLGVAGEFFIDVKAGTLETQIRKANNELILLLEQEANDAKISSGSALEQVAKANEHASQNEKEAEQLRKDAETERLARVKIEARVAWRRLSDEQKSDLSSKLGDFSNLVAASLWYDGNDIEAKMFGDDITEALRPSHILVQPPSNVMILSSSGKFGDPIKPSLVGVSILPSNFPASIRLADSLIRELNFLGFDAFRRKDTPFKESKFPEVEVFVYPRPEGPQGEFKLQAEKVLRAKSKSYAKP